MAVRLASTCSETAWRSLGAEVLQARRDCSVCPLAASLVDVGELVEAEPMTSAALHELEAAGDVTVVPDAEIVLARIAALRGDTQAALEWVKRLSSADVLSSRLIAEATMARILADAGDHEAARQLLADIVDPTRSQAGSGEDLRDAVPAAVAIGDLEVAERLLDRALPPWPSVGASEHLRPGTSRGGAGQVRRSRRRLRGGRRPMGGVRVRAGRGRRAARAGAMPGRSRAVRRRRSSAGTCPRSVRADGGCSRGHGG